MTPEEKALNLLDDSEVAFQLYLSELIPLHHVLAAIYAAFEYDNLVVILDWSEADILIYSSRNKNLSLAALRVKLSELIFVPKGWSVFFLFDDDTECCDSLSFDARRRA